MPSKTITQTSEAHTSIVAGTERVAIGEIVRYRLKTRLPEGSLPNLQLVDALPAGLLFLNDGTAKVALICNGACITSSLLSGTGLVISGNETTVDTLLPTFVLTSTHISGAPFNDGTDPTFNLGDLTNNDNDADQEFVVVEFNALVDNIVGNQAFNNATGVASATTLTNTFTVRVNGAQVGSAAPNVAVNIAEPVVRDLAKTITTTPSDAGDTLVYRLTYSNSASGNDRANAYDVVLTDTLSSVLDLQTVAVTSPAGTTVTDNSTLGVGGVVRVTLDQLPPVADIAGATKGVTVTITARVLPTAANGLTISNTANLTYSSLPITGTLSNPTGSITPGTSGTATGERNGSTGVGGLNDYVSTSGISTTLATPTISKLAPSPITYTIGATITYDVRVTLPEGVTPNLVITDTLPSIPAGSLVYVSHQVITTTAASNGNLTADYNGTVTATPIFTNTSPTLLFDFGAPTTTDDNVATNNAFLLRLVARVANIVGNQAGTTLTNTAAMRYTNPNTGASVNVAGGSQIITVTEPSLTLSKAITTLPSPADAGGVITYTITLTNATGASVSIANDTVYTDTLPSALSLNLASIGITSVGSCATGIADNSSGNTVDARIGAMPPGCVVTITYNATLALGVNPDQTITNLGRIAWTSLSGSDANERTGADGPGGALNDYAAQSSRSFTTASPAISKALESTSLADTTCAKRYHRRGDHLRADDHIAGRDDPVTRHHRYTAERLGIRRRFCGCGHHGLWWQRAGGDAQRQRRLHFRRADHGERRRQCQQQ